MIKYLFFIFALYVSLNSSAQNKTASYFPPLHKWEHTPAQLYFDTSKLAKAIAFAKDHESKQPRGRPQKHHPPHEINPHPAKAQVLRQAHI